MPSLTHNTPALRFPGYTGVWEQHKLEEILTIVVRKNNNQYTKQDVLSVSDTYGCINQIKFQGRSFAGADISNYKIVKTNDIVYTKSPLQAKPFGIIKIVRDETGIVSPLYVINTVKENNDAQFVYYYFDSPEKTNRYLAPLVRKGAKNTMNISNEEWLSGSITIAPSLEEQKKIGSLFHNLDDRINLHQRQTQKLTELKQGLLQEMFPREGESVPRLRFPGFTTTWKQQKLGDIGKTYTGLSGKSKTDFGHGKAHFVTYMNVYSHPVADINQVDSCEIDSKQHEVQYGDVFFTTSSETPDEVGMSSVWLGNIENTYLNSFCFGYRPDQQMDPYFMAYILRSPTLRDQFILLAQGISRYNISKNKAMDIKLSLPSLSEQQKIGSFFHHFDDLINLHERYVTILIHLKKGLLQKMFPQD